MTEQPNTAPEPDGEPDPPAWTEVTITADHDGDERKHVFRVIPSVDFKDLRAVSRFAAGNAGELSMVTTVDRVLKRSMCDDDGEPARSGREVAFDAGSSRRRWLALWADDAVSIDTEQLMDTFHTLMGGAGERPTRR